MSNDVTVVDYGIGNLFSVCRALEYCGANVQLTRNPEEVLSASKVLLPGVGAFDAGMRRLNEYDLADAIKGFSFGGGFLLGICLGMQMLLESSEEFGADVGLGIIPGQVVSLPAQTEDGEHSKIPHIGWSDLRMPDGRRSWDDTLLRTTKEGTAMYFLHSFMAIPSDAKYRHADCLYDGTKIPALIGYENVWGAQFHPEKSGEGGLKILREFLSR